MGGYLSNAKRVVAAMALASFALVGISSVASAGSLHPSTWHRTDTPSSFTVAEILAGSSLTHTFTVSESSASVSAPLSNIDDLTQLGNELFVAFQNGVGPNGEASAAGNLDSTVVEFTPSGRVLGQWDVAGRIDGIVADPNLHGVIATVNEDGNSSLYVIDTDTSTPSAQQVTYFSYDSGLTHGGGTDSLAILHGQILISASNPPERHISVGLHGSTRLHHQGSEADATVFRRRRREGGKRRIDQWHDHPLGSDRSRLLRGCAVFGHAFCGGL